SQVLELPSGVCTLGQAKCIEKDEVRKLVAAGFRTAAMMSSCRCFARRVNLSDAPEVATESAGKNLVFQSAFYGAWGCFRAFGSRLKEKRGAKAHSACNISAIAA